MKKNAPPQSASVTPSKGLASLRHRGEEGGGVEKIPQSTIKLLRPDQVWQPRIGAPRGNQNALTRLGAIRRRVRDLKRRARLAAMLVP